MPVEKTNTTKQATAVQTAKLPAEPAAPANDQNHTAATPKEVAPTATEVAKDPKPSWLSRLSFKQVVPFVILLLAAGILFGI